MILSFLAAFASAAPGQFVVQQLRSTRGSIEISLFDKSADWDAQTPSSLLTIRPLVGDVASLTVDLPPGEYAFFLYQDVNENGQLERSLIGFPREPYAVSNNVKLRFSKPSWEDMKFVVGETGATQTVDLNQP